MEPYITITTEFIGSCFIDDDNQSLSLSPFRHFFIPYFIPYFIPCLIQLFPLYPVSMPLTLSSHRLILYISGCFLRTFIATVSIETPDFCTINYYEFLKVMKLFLIFSGSISILYSIM